MRVLGILIVLSLIAGNAVAGPIRWDVNGTIDFTRDADLLPLNAQTGSAYTYTVIFDDETADVYPEPELGSFPGAIQSIVFSTGGLSFDVPIAAGSTIQTDNEVNNDYFALSFLTQSGANDAIPLLMTQLNFQSSSPLFGSDALPGAPPSLVGLNSALFYLFEYQTPGQANGTEPIPLVIGSINSIVQTPLSVPEPDSVALLAAGLFGLGFSRRRRKESRD